MKKIYLLFSLLFAITWQAATAQAFLVSDAPSNGEWATKTYWYTIKNNNTYYLSTTATASQTINETATDVLLLNQTALTGTDGAAADAEMWCVVGSESGGYQFYNKASGASKVLGITILSTSDGGTDRASMVDASTTSATTNNVNDVVTNFIRLSATKYDYSDIFYLNTETTGWYLNNRTVNSVSYLSLWEAGSNYVTWWSSYIKSDGGSNFVFEPADDFTEAYRAAEEALSGVTAGVIFGPTQEAYDALNTALTTYKNADPTSDNVTALTELTTTFTNSKISLPTTDTKVFFGNKGRSGYYVNACTTTVRTSGDVLGCGNAKNSPSYVFTLKPQGDGTFKIYSEYYDKYVGAVPSQNNYQFPLVDEANAVSYTITNTSGSYASIYDASSTADYTAWHMCDMTDSFWSQCGGAIVRWTSTADPSLFLIEVGDDVEEALSTWYTELKEQATEVIGLAGCTTFGYPNYSNTSDVSTAYTTFTNDEKAYNYKALETAIAAATYTINGPTAKHYYTITSAQDENYRIYDDYENGYAATQQIVENENLVPALWTFVATENTDDDGYTLYNIQAANLHNGTAYYIPFVGWAGTATLATEGGLFGILNPYTTSSSYIKYSNSVSIRGKQSSTSSYDCTLCVLGDWNSSTPNGHISTMNATGDYYNNWYVEEATEIPVTVSSAGYATLNLPFAVIVPTSGSIGVYTASVTTTDGTDEMALTETYTDGTTIPANTPVVLVAEGGATETFAIDYTNGDEAFTSALTGVLAPQELASNDGNYILKNGDDGIGFYLVNSETTSKLSANRAYYKNAAATTNMLKFNLDETTGINAISTDKAADSYYDLQGRRVLYPVHGVFVKGNGQKVYIK